MNVLRRLWGRYLCWVGQHRPSEERFDLYRGLARCSRCNVPLCRTLARGWRELQWTGGALMRDIDKQDRANADRADGFGFNRKDVKILQGLASLDGCESDDE